MGGKFVQIHLTVKYSLPPKLKHFKFMVQLLKVDHNTKNGELKKVSRAKFMKNHL